MGGFVTHAWSSNGGDESAARRDNSRPQCCPSASCTAERTCERCCFRNWAVTPQSLLSRRPRLLPPASQRLEQLQPQSTQSVSEGPCSVIVVMMHCRTGTVPYSEGWSGRPAGATHVLVYPADTAAAAAAAAASAAAVSPPEWTAAPCSVTAPPAEPTRPPPPSPQASACGPAARFRRFVMYGAAPSTRLALRRQSISVSLFGT